MSAEDVKSSEEAAAAASCAGAGGADVPPVTQPAPPAGTADPGAQTRVEADPEGEVLDAEPAPEPDPVAAAEARAAEYLALAQRKQAEFENFRKRMQAQLGQAEERGVAKVAKELLSPLDHLGLALEAAEQHGAGEEWTTALRGVQEELRAALARVGVEYFDPRGEPFDPTLHEAMASQPADGVESGTVAITYQPGYRLKDSVLRPARVVVAQ